MEQIPLNATNSLMYILIKRIIKQVHSSFNIFSTDNTCLVILKFTNYGQKGTGLYTYLDSAPNWRQGWVSVLLFWLVVSILYPLSKWQDGAGHIGLMDIPYHCFLLLKWGDETRSFFKAQDSKWEEPWHLWGRISVLAHGCKSIETSLIKEKYFES